MSPPSLRLRKGAEVAPHAGSMALVSEGGSRVRAFSRGVIWGIFITLGSCPCFLLLSVEMVCAKRSSQQLARAMAGRDLDRTFAPRKLLPSATSSSSSGTQCRGGADSARQALCGCRSTSLHMLHGSCVLQNAEQRNGDRFRECARSHAGIGLGVATLRGIAGSGTLRTLTITS